MNIREYNKLYINKDREEGSQKLLLGYQNDVREIILYKDTETVFHVPFFAEPVKLNQTNLIRDGATGGPFPAAADRIFKNKKNYGNVTPNGSSTETVPPPDGTWFCSWLYKDEYGNVQWMDRYYNPGAFIVGLAHEQLSESSFYRKNNPVYRDVPSSVTLEAGVQYRYFHIGETTSTNLIDSTFFGVSGERLLLNLVNWGTENVDTSNSNISLHVDSNAPYDSLYKEYTNTDRVSARILNFNNEYNNSIWFAYDSSYNPTSEFTWAFWAQSNNWQEGQTTQLIGNQTNNGGVGIFIDTLSCYPFLCLLENSKNGHLLFVNNETNCYKDKLFFNGNGTQYTPQFIAIDLDYNCIVGYLPSISALPILIEKYDNAGNLLKTTHDYVRENKDIYNHYTFEQDEYPIQLLCGQNDTVIFITNKKYRTYDSSLKYVNEYIRGESGRFTIAAHAYTKNNTLDELRFKDNVYDHKCLETVSWSISSANIIKGGSGNVYRDNTLFASYNSEIKATNLNIDPLERVWVLHGNNELSVYENNAQPYSKPIFSVTVGSNIPHTKKTINFICTYDRKVNTKTWKCIIYYNDGPSSQLYILDLSGKLLETIDLISLFNVKLIENQTAFNFSSIGDFTGYEHRRVFNKMYPYYNKPQLIIKASLKDKTRENKIRKFDLFKTYSSIDQWEQTSWRHLVMTLKNHEFKLYDNGKLKCNLPFSGQYEMSYELQPNFFIGSPVGSQYGFNNEIKYPGAIFNGMFEDIKIYDYAIDAKLLEIFQRASIPAQNIYWSLPTPQIQYIETVERMFKNKIPGSKSTYFVLKLCGTQIKDIPTRNIIEQEIRLIVEKTKPVYANFLRIEWVD